MPGIIHKIGIKKPIDKVYNALATPEGIASWWTRNTSGSSKVGGNLEFRFLDHGKEKGRMTVDILTHDPNKKVVWKFTAGPQEWIGSDVTFKLHQDGDLTIVIFEHNNWKEITEFTAHCSMKWATFLLSLREYLETGKGRPAPDDMKIDNWN